MTVLARQGVGLSLFLAILVFALDRGHKYVQIEMAGWRGGEVVPVTGFFDYMLLWNTGISYGLLDALPVEALLALMAVAMVFLLWWWWRADTRLARYGLALCIGGAASHIIDRWVYGAVPDFFHFHWGDWSFYVFNISDTVITIGVGLLILDVFRPRRGQAGQP